MNRSRLHLVSLLTLCALTATSCLSTPELREVDTASDAGLVDFDECKPGQACAARNSYLAHNTNRSHQKITLPDSSGRTAACAISLR